MEELIALLREQTVLCNQLLKLFGELETALKTNSRTMTDTTKKIEPIILQLNRNADSAQNFLSRGNVKTFGDFLNAQEEGIKRNLAASLLRQTASLQNKIKQHTGNIARLTKTGSAFVEFNLNILSRTAANTTYGAEANTGSRSGRRLFDANV